MKFIKTYSTEDLFAEMENNSGYPEDAVTSIVPGFAYVKEDSKVYYNEEPLPDHKIRPLTGTRLKNSIYYWWDSNNNEWVRSSSDRPSYLLFPVSAGSMDVLANVEAYKDGTDFWYTLFENGQEITVNEGDIWAFDFVRNEDDLNATVVNARKMYTNGETYTITSSTQTIICNIYYFEGDETNTKYYALAYEETYNNHKQEWYNVFDDIYIENELGDPKTQVTGLTINIFDNVVDFPYIFGPGIYKDYDGNNDPQLSNHYYPVSYGAVEQVYGETYQLTELMGMDATRLNIMLTPGKDYALIMDQEEETIKPKVLTYSDDVITVWNDQGGKYLFRTVYVEGDDTPYYTGIGNTELNDYGNGILGNEMLFNYGAEFICADYNNIRNTAIGIPVHFSFEDSDFFNLPEPEDVDPDWPSQDDMDHRTIIE